MEFILASGNSHKVEELNKLFEESKLSVSASPEKIEVVEDGESFQENAFKKAEGYFKKFKEPVLSDDSGLVVPKLPNILGIHSARFAPELSDYSDKCKKLIELIGSYSSNEDRAAYFVCVICAYISPTEVYFFEGRVHGTIATELSGSDGFGYDPIFLPDGQDGKSYAEVIEWKMKNSHRAKACESMDIFFTNRK